MLSLQLVGSVPEHAHLSQLSLPILKYAGLSQFRIPIPEYARLSQFSFVLEDSLRFPVSSLWLACPEFLASELVLALQCWKQKSTTHSPFTKKQLATWKELSHPQKPSSSPVSGPLLNPMLPVLSKPPSVSSSNDEKPPSPKPLTSPLRPVR